MKKCLLWLACIPLAFSMIAFSACGESFEDSSVEQGDQNDSSDDPVLSPIFSPFAALDKIDEQTAFQDDGSEEWSFGLRLTADLNTDVSARWYSEAAQEERFYTMAGAFLTADDTFGLRKNTLGKKELFGGGQIALGVRGAAPSSASPVREKKLEAGLYHDGDWIVLAKADGSETKVEAKEFGTYLANACENEMLSNITETVSVIPQSLAEGKLRLGVEKLVSLGFEADVTEEDGVKVRLRADVELLTDWLNDALTSVLPETVLNYIPRIDLRYRSDLLELYLAFDETGAFEEYTMSSNVAVESELRVRGLFAFTCDYAIKGGLSVLTADGVPETEETL